ncbi:MAG: hypothetical protein AAF491_10310 [Verrucomicrobiota bacterium]
MIIASQNGDMIRAATLLVVFVFATGPLRADRYLDVSRTQKNTLNDLVRELPILSPSWERQLRELSAIQEQLYLFEREMRGEGLPQPLAQAFAIHYDAIVNAIVEDRISEEYGRDLLSVHRQLLAKSQEWTCKRIRDEAFPGEVINNLHFFLMELEENSLSLFEVSPSIRTPVINGYQVWLGELLAWGCECNRLSPGARGRILRKMEILEQFEVAVKRDGYLNRAELELLHERFLNLTRDTVEILVRS